MADEVEMQQPTEQKGFTPFATKSADQGAAAPIPAPDASSSFSTGISNQPEEAQAAPVAPAPVSKGFQPFPRVQGTEKQAPQGNVPQAQPAQPKDRGVLSGAYEQTIGGFANLAKVTSDYYKNKLGKDPDTQSYLELMSTMANPIKILKDAIVDKDHPLHQIAVGLAQAHAKEITTSQDKLHEAYNFAQMGDYKSAFGSLIQSQGHALAAAIPGVGPAAAKIGEDFSTEPKFAAGETAGIVGSILAPGAISRGARAAVTPISEEAPGLVRPGVTDIAGTKVPISAPQVAGEPTAAGVERAPFVTRQAAKLGTEKAAGEMIEKYTQPKAVEATGANLSDKALDEVDKLRQVRGEAPLKPTHPVIDQPAEAADLMKKTAQETYKPLDTAIESDHAVWEKAKAQWENVDNPKPQPRPKASPTTAQQTAGSKAVDAQRFKGEMQSWKDANDAWEAAHPEPRSFSELQGDIQQANRTINSKSAAVTSDMRNQAIKDLKEAKQQMADFTTKYGKLVKPGELEAANNLYSQYYKMSELSDKLKTIIKGTTDTESGMIRQPAHINVERLESIPNELEKETGWGNGEFDKFMGPERMKNWNDVINALKNPLKGKPPMLSWLPGFGRVLRMPINALMNRMLFDPEFGRTALQMYRSGANVTQGATREALSVGRVGQAMGQQIQPTHRFNPDTGKVEEITQ